MFVQVISGKVGDPTTLKALGLRWIEELSPGASGWLSSTSGVTADGVGVVFACFESAEAARRNSDRPEQGEWWSQAEKCFVEPPTFGNFDDAIVVRGGVTASAGFVQAMLGQVSDPVKDRELTKQFASMDSDMRPDLVGGIIGIGDDGRFAQAFYFTTEAEARIGEKSEVPEEMAKAFAEEQELITEINYYDLLQPEIHVAD